MSYYEKQELDFIKRTKKIIEQYDNIHFQNSEERFEKTLFINCLVGLLIIPQQHWFNILPRKKITENWGIRECDIKFISNNIKTIRNIARHLRNSITHYNFKILPDKNGEIEKIKFIDINNDVKSFEAIIKIDNLKTFTYKLTDFLIEEIEREK